ncbi:MAG: apolipoprotein N-acyltransferase [Nitriliruptorales bacterium]|nr:apolipoprotein N-acyltransferase [Nitriliruptorales bacterium]
MRQGPLALGTAVLAGLTIYASQPPLGWWPTVFLAPGLLLVSLRLAPERAGLLGLATGLAAYLPMLLWLIEPAGFLAWFLLSLVQSLFLVVTAVVTRPYLGSRWIVLVAPIVWVGADAWRNLVPLGGFGWGALAYAHVDGSWMLPVARVLGQHGLTLLTVAVGALAYDIWRTATETRVRGVAGFARLQPAFILLVAVLLLSVAITVEPPAADEVADVLVVQGNDDPERARTGPAEDRRIASNLVELTSAAVGTERPPDVTVWPESSIDRDPYTESGADLRRLLEEGAAVVDGGLLVGANLEGPRPGTFLNTVLHVGNDGEVVERYVKRHLVPFGEFVPWRSVLGDVGPLRQIPRDGVPGEGPQPISVDGVDVASVICFESLFPHLVRENVRGAEADLIVVATNDASFGVSAEPAQHLAQSRLRAVETGRWVIHASLAGASAFVDAGGAVHDRTDLFELTTIRRDVPLVSGSTPFLTFGDVVGFAARFALLALLVVVLIRARRKPPEG